MTPAEERIVEKMGLFDVRMFCLDGLCTDGGHHKQWYLEEILKKVCGVLGEDYQNLVGVIPGYAPGVAP